MNTRGLTPLTRWQQVVTLVVLLGAAAYYVLVELHRPGYPSTDLYTYFLPNMVYAVRSVADGGRGLLWNPYQACGSPFFANGQNGLLYPPQWLFLVLDANVAAHAVLLINMVVGALGMFRLAREIGLGWLAAFGGALAFELGEPMAQFTGWNPMISGAWAWFPWALLYCERLLRAPGRRSVASLAIVLAIQLLPGTVIINALTYQVIAFRVAWDIITRGRSRRCLPALSVGAALAVAPLLVAIQLFPNVEFGSDAFRASLPTADILKEGGLPLSDVMSQMAKRGPPVPFLIAPLLLAGLAPFAYATRRLAIFYLLIGGLYGVLALGEATPLLKIYLWFPPGAAVIRAPGRLYWISGFCLAMLAALGLQALADPSQSARRRWVGAAVTLALGAALYGFAPGGLRWSELGAVAGVAAATLAAITFSTRVSVPPRGPYLVRSAAWVAAAALTLNLVTVPLRWWGSLLPSVGDLWAHVQTFSALRPPITVQDRTFFMPSFLGVLKLKFMQRTATLLGVRTLSDYDNIPGRRYVEYFTMLRKGVPFSNILDGYLPFPWVTPGVRRRLLDLAAVRYLIAPSPDDVVDTVLKLPRRLSATGLYVYENDTAVARARYVPRIEVIPDANALLHRLAHGDDDLTTVAFVEESPPSGFSGEAGPHGPGSTRVLTDDPEHVVIEVAAPARGFVVLADRYYPGWRATVNGTAAPILRGNHLFRLIEVPAGSSRVEFRYRSTYLLLGAGVSALSCGFIAMVLWSGRRTR